MGDVRQATRINVWAVVLAIVGLLAFEVMRELYVLEADAPRFLIGPPLLVVGDTEEVHAEGIWRRSDGGSPIQQGTVAIRCIRAWAACIEVNNSYMPDVLALNSTIDVRENAEFDSEAVEFESVAECARYRVRIDLKQRRVTATRDRLPGANAEKCALLEDRVTMEMADGDRYTERVDAAWTEEHFLPLYRLLLPLIDGR